MNRTILFCWMSALKIEHSDPALLVCLAGTTHTCAPQHIALRTTSCRHSSSIVAQAAANATQQQLTAASRLQQQQQPRQQQQQQRRSRSAGPFPPPLTNKPYVVRIAGRTSSIQGAAGAITKRLRTDVSLDTPFQPWYPVGWGFEEHMQRLSDMPPLSDLRTECSSIKRTAQLLVSQSLI